MNGEEKKTTADKTGAEKEEIKEKKKPVIAPHSSELDRKKNETFVPIDLKENMKKKYIHLNDTFGRYILISRSRSTLKLHLIPT